MILFAVKTDRRVVYYYHATPSPIPVSRQHPDQINLSPLSKTEKLLAHGRLGIWQDEEVKYGTYQSILHMTLHPYKQL